ncbi:MAG: transporter [Deltaproteobacteria bacterium]|nr:transporter [Deltaproteobacteria bacterium]
MISFFAATSFAFRPDSHAPIGVMGDHTHNRGEIMFSYRYMHMSMSGLRQGTSGISSGIALENYMVVPTDMSMDMHMLGMMYSPHDRLTFALMIPFIDMSMDHVTQMGMKFRTNSSGIGDIQINPLIKVWENENHHVHLQAGMSFPTGSIEQRGDTPAGENMILPYPMQLGSGTFDVLPGITYTGKIEKWSWGFQGAGVIRLGTNSRDYALGDQLKLTAWGARKWNDWLSQSLRIEGKIWSDIEGADPMLNPMMVSTANTKNHGGKRLDVLLGLNFGVPRGFFKGHRIAIEGGIPVYQDLNGVQLETDWMLTAGWQYAF